MKTSVAVFCVLAVTGIALADPYSQAIQQAQRASNQNAAEQQRIQNQSGGAPENSAAASASPELQAALQNISSLQADIVALNAATDAGSAGDQRIALLNDLSSAGTGTKPSSDSVKVLVKDLVNALAGKKIAAERQTSLARNLHAVFNSSHLTAAQQQAVGDNVQKILTDAGDSAAVATAVVTDLKKIADETK